MLLNIKEIFKSDLDPNQSNWFSNAKIDKLNINFGLLAGGGVRGPQGTQGAAGLNGSAGINGDLGVQGPIGNQGFSGQDANLNWRYIDGLTNRTIYPNIENDDFFGVAVLVGMPQSTSEYENAAAFNQVSQYRSIAKEGINQLSLRYADYKYDYVLSASGNELMIGNLSGALSLLESKYILINNSSIKYKLGSKVFDISQNLLSYHNLKLKDTVIRGKCKLLSNASPSKILTSIDLDGNVIWKNRSDVLFSLPVGSIVSIPIGYFNQQNFELKSAFNVVNGVLQIYWGRGKENTLYEGWYLCNGETWNIQGGNSFEVPNLNSFNYNINTNNGNQSAKIDGNNTRILIGGADAHSISEFDTSDLRYTTNLTVDTSDVPELFETGITHSTIRNVNIINLGNPYLYWITEEVEDETEPITLSSGSLNSNAACLDTVDTGFTWTGGSITWSNLSANMTNISLFKNNILAASNQWYAKDGVARYWDGIKFTQVVACPVTGTIQLAFNISVLSLNGTVSSSGTYVINATRFEDATTLTLNGSNAPIGWYRGITAGAARRFWNGTSFIGESIFAINVFFAGNLDVSYHNSSSACQFTDAEVKIYYATNAGIVNTGNILQDIRNTSGVVYVHINWQTGANGTIPLVKIYSQNGIGGGTTPYNSIIAVATSDQKTYRSNITINSEILAPVLCLNYIISGGTSINNMLPNTFGSISVTSVPTIITLTVFGGAGGNQCFTNATLNITGGVGNFGVGLISRNAGPFQTVVGTIIINNIGVYQYTLGATFGCNFGNSATIS